MAVTFTAFNPGHVRADRKLLMAGWFPVFDAAVEHLIRRLAPASALDLGPGAGKAGRWLCAHAPEGERIAVDADPRVMDRCGPDRLYTQVHRADIHAWAFDSPGRSYDLAILEGGLGQMPKSKGLDLLNLLVQRCAWVVVVAPEFVVDPLRPGDCGDPAAPPYLSSWCERDMRWHDLWAWDNCRSTTLVVLRGYRPSPLTLAQWVGEVNAERLPVLHFDGATLVRPTHLRMVQAPREVDYRLP